MTIIKIEFILENFKDIWLESESGTRFKFKFGRVYNAFNTIRLYKRQGCVTDSCPVRESQDNLLSSLDFINTICRVVTLY